MDAKLGSLGAKRGGRRFNGAEEETVRPLRPVSHLFSAGPDHLVEITTPDISLRSTPIGDYSAELLIIMTRYWHFTGTDDMVL